MFTIVGLVLIALAFGLIVGVVIGVRFEQIDQRERQDRARRYREAR